MSDDGRLWTAFALGAVAVLGAARRGSRQAPGWVLEAVRLEPLGHGDRIQRLIVRRKVGHGFEDDLMLAPVEVAAQHHLGHVEPGVVVQHQSTEHGLLGVQGVRRNFQRAGCSLAGGAAVWRPLSRAAELELTERFQRLGHQIFFKIFGNEDLVVAWRLAGSSA